MVKVLGRDEKVSWIGIETALHGGGIVKQGVPRVRTTLTVRITLWAPRVEYVYLPTYLTHLK